MNRASAAQDQSLQPAPAQAGAGCFHCGLPLDGLVFPVTIDGASHDTCCAGCQAVAQAIADNGLSAYYRNRSAPAPPAREADLLPAELGVFDLPEVQRDFVASSGGNLREASLLIDGVTCAACIWLIEQRLARLPGVREVRINYATRRARVGWDETQTTLSSILAAVAALGYAAHPYDPARAEERLRAERSSLLWRLFIAGFGMMQVMMYAVPVYIADGAMTPDIEQLMRLASLVLTLPAALWSALPFYRGALRDLRARRPGMDVPVSLGIVIAFVASLWATWTASGEVYFDSVTMFVFLLLGARYLELEARARAVRSQDRLARLAPLTAELLEAGDAGMRVVAAASLQPGDRLRLRPGAAVPADGVVLSGVSATDESLLTGESRPVPKRAGDMLTGGSVNLDGVLTMRVTRAGEATVLSGILRLLDRAQSEKPRIAQAADRLAAIFVTALLVLAVAAFAAWWMIEPSRALWIAVSLLVVTCPCALSLATPLALAAATGSAYREGMLITRGSALETLARATQVVFDKTGTLTTGRMTLAGVVPLGDAGREQCLALAAALESWSEHPAARALVQAATGVHPVASAVRNVTGEGVEGIVAGRRCRIGKPQFVAALHGLPLPAQAGVPDALSVVALGDESGWIALFLLDDLPRHDAASAVAALKVLGLRVSLLSGDRPQRAAHAAAALGIGEGRGGATPADKLEYVRALQARGEVVVMIGDGVNDAPVLAQAQVSIAPSGGTALAQTSADIVLMTDRLDALPASVAMARRTLSVIHQNLAWAAGYNLVAVPLALAGMVTPLIAAIGMSSSSLLVVANALRLARHADRGASLR
ncbi:MAG: heavy metal translocating P-type ATPase [Betaproteobacteria bacterium]|jgi:Cu2+-exporting ATPase